MELDYEFTRTMKERVLINLTYLILWCRPRNFILVNPKQRFTCPMGYFYICRSTCGKMSRSSTNEKTEIILPIYQINVIPTFILKKKS